MDSFRMRFSHVDVSQLVLQERYIVSPAYVDVWTCSDRQFCGVVSAISHALDRARPEKL